MVPTWKCRSSGKHWKAASMRRSERNVYSWELYWIFREIAPSLQDVIICNFLALSQTYEKRRGLEVISPKASSEGLIRARCTFWTWGTAWKKGIADGFNLFGKCSGKMEMKCFPNTFHPIWNNLSTEITFWCFSLPWFGGPHWKAIFFGHYVLVGSCLLAQVVGQPIALDAPAARDIPGHLD